MNFWIIILLIVVLVGLFKSYLIRGVYQASQTKKWALFYGLGSIGSFAIGLPTLLTAFANGIIGLSLWQNFVIALMCSVLICELILCIFFLADDILGLIKWLQKKWKQKEQPQYSPGPRRKFLKQTGLALTALPFSSFLYGITKGKYDFRVVEQSLSFDDLPAAFDGFKIVQFSDLHSGGFDSYEDVAKGFKMIQDQNPDLILFTGDLVNDLEGEIIPYKPLLSQLKAPFGKFSVLGNHDYPQDTELFPTEAAGLANLAAIKQHHADAGFQLLNNANVQLQKEKDSIRLIGVENWGKGFLKKGDLDQAIIGTQKDEFSILMSHDPSHWEEKVLHHDKHIHLTLAGHTHGMQMGIELMGLKWSPIQYFYKRWAGLYQELNQYLYVNRGFGFIAFAGRVGIPPEITVITLKRKKNG